MKNDLSIQKFIKNINNPKNIEVLGKGAAGTVYLDKTQNNDSVFKISSKDNVCRDWEKEINIYKIINEYNIDTEKCKVLKMKNYIKDDKSCYLELTRAFNPKGADEYYTIHPLFQVEERYLKHKDRGLYMGINNMIEEGFFTKQSIKEYIKDLGIIMARLHYFVKNDGYDIELFLSKENEKIVIYIADFDMSNMYTEVTDEVIERLEWSLSAVEYFPMDGPLYDIFSSAYIKEASKYDMEETAKKVLSLYTGFM